ncbi:glycosyltransferase family protein [Clostridium brassicae]|uniref:Glycosyltransferase family protein n=1 Tax=Clostridium brassicae TaxID=2999072 RepID=A0ABT4DD83_9CLOT|nr:glycosyltransferase family protein [Clostridium brassicae]MCY6959583.1 glycosyltransferase family protein [Clostridium brassicae]
MKVLAIVQARMGSERLPGKVVKPILNKPMIMHTLDRLKKSKYIDKVVLATSDLEKDDILNKTVKEGCYDVFRGSEDNVLERYKITSDKYCGDIIIRVTGDCPLIDPVIVDNVVSYFLMNNFDYVRLDVPESFIRGFDVEVFSKEALDKTFKLAKEEKYKEHVTLYMYNHPEIFKIGYVKGNSFYKKDYRLCVDTEEDFKLVSLIYENFNDENVSAKDVVEFLDKNREIANVNKQVVQKNV